MNRDTLHGIVQEAEELVEESWEPEQQEGGEVSGESPAEVTQPLTRLASAGTAACCLDDAFGSGDLAAAMEARSEALDWKDRGQEGEPGAFQTHSTICCILSACWLVGCYSW